LMVVLRGCVPLFSGDVLLMCGTFQECMQHKTLPFRPSGGACFEASRVPSIVREVMEKYPGTSAEGFARLHQAVEQGLQADGEDRGVLTFRRIAHHYDGSGVSTRCPSLPAPCAPGAPSPCMSGASSTHDVAAVPPTSAADVDPAGEDSEDSVDSVDVDSVDSVNVTAAGLPSNVDAPRAGAAVSELEAVVGYVNDAAWPPLGGSGLDLQRPEILNVMISADEFIRYLGRLEADLQRIHSTTPLEQQDRVRDALDTLMSKAAAFYRQKHIADIKSESDARLAELHTFNDSKGAFLRLRQPLYTDNAWAKGTWSSALRIVVPLTVVQLMFLNADVSRCVYTEGSVAVRLSDSTRLAEKNIYFIQGDKVRTMNFRNVSSRWAQFKTFELGLDYLHTMDRVQLNIIPKGGSTREAWHEQIRTYLSMWWTFLKTLKQRQLTIEDRTQWPDNLPWRVHTVWDMPVVIWLTKNAA
jgi:hypothetical protein